MKEMTIPGILCCSFYDDDDDEDARKLKTKRDDRNILSRKDQEKWDYWKGWRVGAC